jgi:hypothetical protein
MSRSRWILLAAVLVFGRGPTWAEDDRVIEEPPAPQAQADQQHLIDLGANFDANLFEQGGNGWVLRGGNANIVVAPQGQLILNGRRVLLGAAPAAAEEQPPETPSFARARSLGEKRLERIAASSDLTDAQQRKLRLAMESDIRRFAATVDATRARYAGARVNLNDPEGQKKWHQFQQDVQECRQLLRRLFDPGSLFAAALPSTLDAAQVARIDAELKARRSFRWRMMVVSTLAKMDDMLGLTQSQHDLLAGKLLANEPPLRIDELSPEQENAHLQLNLVYMVLSGVDATPLQKATSERQWRTLALLMNQGKSMRSWIEQQGILETGEAAATPGAVSRRRPVRP